MLNARLILILLFTLVVNSLSSKEILYEGKYFKSETSLSDFLYLSEDYKPLISITVEGIESQRPCSYLESFLQNSLKAAYQLKDAELLEYLFISSKKCPSNINNNEIYLRYLIEVGKLDESYEFLELLDNENGDFPLLENRLFQASGRWKYFQKFSASFVQNSNINNGFTADVVNLFGMPFEVSDDAVPRNDIGLKLSHTFAVMKYLTKSSQLRFRTNINAEDYSGHELDRYSPFFSADYVFTPEDMLSIGVGRNYWNNEEVFNTQSISYSRKVNKFSFLNMLRLSIGQTDSPINQTNSSEYLSLQTLFSLKSNWNMGISYTKNDTEFGFSSYQSIGASVNKNFNFQKIEITPFVEINKRVYKKEWAAYGVTRSYLQKHFGVSMRKDGFTNLTVDISRTRYDSNIVIYDNQINLIEINYSFN